MAYLFLNVGRFLGMKMLIERLTSRLGIPSDSGFTREVSWFLLKNVGGL